MARNPEDIKWYGKDDETALANRGHIISFVSLYVGLRADFKASITNLIDNFNCAWESDQPYGKSEPTMHFQGTERYIQLSWDVHAANEEEAAENLRRASAMAQMLYPVYENRGFPSNQSSNPEVLTAASKPNPPGEKKNKAQKRWCISAPPLVTLKLSNLIQANEPEKVRHKDASKIADRFLGDPIIEGVIAVIDQYSFTPDLSVGFFELPSGILLPKKISLACTLNVQHQNPPGIVDNYGPTGTGANWAATHLDTYGVGAADPAGFDGSTSLPTAATGFTNYFKGPSED